MPSAHATTPRRHAHRQREDGCHSRHLAHGQSHSRFSPTVRVTHAISPTVTSLAVCTSCNLPSRLLEHGSDALQVVNDSWGGEAPLARESRLAPRPAPAPRGQLRDISTLASLQHTLFPSARSLPLKCTPRVRRLLLSQALPEPATPQSEGGAGGWAARRTRGWSGWWVGGSGSAGAHAGRCGRSVRWGQVGGWMRVLGGCLEEVGGSRVPGFDAIARHPCPEETQAHLAVVVEVRVQPIAERVEQHLPESTPGRSRHPEPAMPPGHAARSAREPCLPRVASRQ